MLDAFGFTTIITKLALYLGVLTPVGTTMATMLFGLLYTRQISLTFAVLGLFATVCTFFLLAANLTGDLSGVTDPELIGMLWKTPVGTALLLRLVGLSLLIIGLFMGRLGLWLSLLGGLFAIWSFNSIGHVSDLDSILLDITLVLHLMAVALWIGILTPLKRLVSSSDTYALAADVGHRFGVIASVTVPMLILLGCLMGYQLVGSFANLRSTGYGQAFIAKVLLVGGLLVLSAINKLKFIPALRSGDPVAAKHLSNSLSVEWFFILAILTTTATLSTNLTLPA